MPDLSEILWASVCQLVCGHRENCRAAAFILRVHTQPPTRSVESPESSRRGIFVRRRRHSQRRLAFRNCYVHQHAVATPCGMRRLFNYSATLVVERVAETDDWWHVVDITRLAGEIDSVRKKVSSADPAGRDVTTAWSRSRDAMYGCWNGRHAQLVTAPC